MPNIANYGTTIPNGFETHVIVSNLQTETAYSVRNIKKQIRQCVFESENYLKYYRTYSRKVRCVDSKSSRQNTENEVFFQFSFVFALCREQNCESECETKIVMEHCKCIMYFMPRPYPDVNICGREETSCVNEVTRQYKLQQNASFVCDCMPGCSSLSYESEISLAPMMPKSPLLDKYRLESSHAGVLHVFFRERYFRSQKREEIIGFTEFLCEFGICSETK